MHATHRRSSQQFKASSLRQPQGGGSCQSEHEPLCLDLLINLFYVNLHGFVSPKLHNANLPDVVALTEAWLAKSVVAPSLPGYSLISRLDRRGSRQGGGVAAFARASIAQRITVYERSWHTIHTDRGPDLFAVWYRPPCYGEVGSIHSLEQEFSTYRRLAIASIIVGDMMFVIWIGFSTLHTHLRRQRTSLSLCLRLGLNEKVQSPTRGSHLLDLCLSDIPSGLNCKVLSTISDHSGVLAKLRLKVAHTAL